MLLFHFINQLRTEMSERKREKDIKEDIRVKRTISVSLSSDLRDSRTHIWDSRCECVLLGAYGVLFLAGSTFLCHVDPQGSNTGLQVSHASFSWFALMRSLYLPCDVTDCQRCIQAKIPARRYLLAAMRDIIFSRWLTLALSIELSARQLRRSHRVQLHVTLNAIYVLKNIPMNTLKETYTYIEIYYYIIITGNWVYIIQYSIYIYTCQINCATYA